MTADRVFKVLVEIAIIFNLAFWALWNFSERLPITMLSLAPLTYLAWLAVLAQWTYDLMENRVDLPYFVSGVVSFVAYQMFGYLMFFEYACFPLILSIRFFYLARKGNMAVPLLVGILMNTMLMTPAQLGYDMTAEWCILVLAAYTGVALYVREREWAVMSMVVVMGVMFKTLDYFVNSACGIFATVLLSSLFL